MTTRAYYYRGDRFTDPVLKGQLCHAVLNDKGKCIRGKNGNMLVLFITPMRKGVVLARLLRKITD